ncbi:MAG TPA: superinfection immunity protein [Candidatus Sulfopaludibacter sp.]|jgi:hypothetical protein|nr:superinfection immunity protein [Candidatus Sulfopaludibacter sp.]
MLGGGIFALFLLCAGIAFYFLPSIIGRNKTNSGAIFVLNLLLGWTLVGWVVALVWALTVDTPPNNVVQVIQSPASLPPVGDRFCSFCGHRCRADARFCDGCGRPIGPMGLPAGA